MPVDSFILITSITSGFGVSSLTFRKVGRKKSSSSSSNSKKQQMLLLPSHSKAMSDYTFVDQ